MARNVSKADGERAEERAVPRTKTAPTPIAITPVNFQYLLFEVSGTAPLMQAAFSGKTRQAMKDRMEADPEDKVKSKEKKRPPRDFKDDMLQAMHMSTEGWSGHPASAFRNACIDVCRMVDFKMNYAKMSIFIEADGYDKVDGQPLVRLQVGKPEQTEMATRNSNGSTDIRCRPMWRIWSLKLRVKFDADQFTASDVANLLERAGQQVGVGEGRPYSKKSNGLGFGTFTIKSKKAA